ncbi:cysteine--tRNA ligase [Leucobacter luti]|uniref:Cysteine--tRNA ligase n=1 Tax=Leucobacter luti TaxID=340320 RepID=A0A4V6MCZ8_9MICO|nr:cysteine--tRNA ligase [Leucobacter luti]MBL3698941.1 cysteine--tRNA ligase [Leucobacter luti]RZT66319.1 cysteinyl-tRNA synthetase [Leucobacter luti]
MKQRIYDSRAQAVVDFEPREPGRVSLYVCGPTVQSAPHIGHLRSVLVYDQMRRWFEATGLDVTMIRNVTDIDDKILDHARAGQEAGGTEEWWALAYRVEREFTAAYDALGVLPPTYEPRATANIAEMVALIERLIERGHAYQAGDGSASVYFDTASWPEYGALTRQRRDQMEDAADSEPVGKRDPRDFALWKAHRGSEPESASWPSPWGRGRPGWHIECSAMASRYLGAEFDIHGGGLDLRFPHHENELAQSQAAGDPFARHWIHNGLVNTGGQKMSKSLGNSLFAADLLAQARPIVLRYFLGSAHYRSVLEYSETSLAEAEAAFSRIEGFLARAAEAGVDLAGAGASGGASPELPAEFVAAMRDDFALPQALAVIHQTVRAGNSALDARTEQDAAQIHAYTYQILGMLDVLGLNPNDAHWAAAERTTALDSLVSDLLEQRSEARASRDFAKSDEIRDALHRAGISLEDTPTGTRWSLT